MKKQSTITINDILYDARLGKPLNKTSRKTNLTTQTASVPKVINKRTAHNITRDIQKSSTLNRRVVHHLQKQGQVIIKDNDLAIHSLTVSAEKNVRESVLLKKQPLHFDITRPVAASATTTADKNIVTPTKHAPSTNSHVLSNTQPRLESLIASSLSSAKSHLEEPLHKIKKSKKKMSTLKKTVTVATSVFLLTGFFVYQNMTLLSVNYAAKKAGIHASIPGYTPSGFSASRNVSYQPGKVTVGFFSNTDNRQFNLDEQSSSWNDKDFALAVNSISKGTYRIYEMSGKTIYLYNESDATWMENGIWYTIHGDSKLTSEQLVSIATSI